MDSTFVVDPLATSHFSDPALLVEFDRWVRHDRRSFLVGLTRIAEIDERKLYLPEGYSCMKAFLMDRMGLTEGAAYKRLTTARAARKYPQILVALTDGRLHMRAVLMLGRHLTPGNVDELVAAAAGKTRFELEILLASLCPRPDVPSRIEAILPVPAFAGAEPAAGGLGPLAPERVNPIIPDEIAHTQVVPSMSVPAPSHPLAPERVGPLAERGRVTPLSPGRFKFGGTWNEEEFELYNDVRDLMSHQVPSGDLSQVLVALMKFAKPLLEKRKYGATDRPRRPRPTKSRDHVPAHVRREVRKRDGDRCSFVSEGGRRCEETRFLEFDHDPEPKARGGKATVDNTRLLCRAHNQYGAERVFGTAFMDGKRKEARERRSRTGDCG